MDRLAVKLDSGTPQNSWETKMVKCALNARIEASVVPSIHFDTRADEGHLIVLDGLVTEDLRAPLLEHFTGDPNFDAKAESLPTDKWTREVCDVPPSTSDPDAPPLAPHHRTFGPVSSLLNALQGTGNAASVELQRRLCALYPDFHIYWMPSDQIEPQLVEPVDDDEADEGTDSAPAHCTNVLANAAMQGDSYNYHVDADPASFPDSNFTDLFGRYFNREPHRPLFVSLLVYLNPTWKPKWGAETLFLDSQTDTGIFTVPRPGRVVLLDQDLLHKLAPPTAEAGGRPRFSLVFKLVFVRKDDASPSNVSIARPEFGPVTFFGSSARLQEAKRKALAQAQTDRALVKKARIENEGQGGGE